MPDTNYLLPKISAREAIRRFNAGNLTLVDLRKPLAVASSGRRIPGAEFRDPFVLSHDDPLMRDSRPLATFCVHGHEVSQFGCAMLLLHGRKAVYVAGGFEALLDVGIDTVVVEDAG